MAACPSCGTERASGAGPCPGCGALASKPETGGPPELELDVRPRAPARAAAKTAAKPQEVALELAIDPRQLTDAPHDARASGLHATPALAGPRGVVATPNASAAVGVDIAFDAHLLAEYGDPPSRALLLPFYAWRVLRRQRVIKHALAVRRAEAARAASEAEDALVALGERARPLVEKQPDYAEALDELRRAEDVLRSRDRVLASDQDAQNARLAAVDARLAKIEADLAQAQADERTVVAELGSAQNALVRQEAKLKRAESELRAAQQREAAGTHE